MKARIPGAQQGGSANMMKKIQEMHGNIYLKPEYTNQYDMGVTYVKTFDKGVLEHFELQADVYYNEVSDKIIAMPTSNQFRWTMINLGEVEIRGVDVALQGCWRFGQDWLLDTRVNYTYQKAQDFTKRESHFYGDQIPYIPWHSGSLILNGTYRSWFVNYSFIYTGKRYEASANIPENRAKEWYTSDFSLSKNFSWRKTAIRLTAEINNIFNQQYEVVQCYPMPGTNVKFIVNVTI